jgi:hypothetical protein
MVRNMLQTALPDGLPNRFFGCGRRIVDSRGVVLKAAEGVTHWCGVMTCGLVWVCPVCSAKIRAHRMAEVRTVLTGALQAECSVGFLTLTFRHHGGQKLGDLLDAGEAAWKRLQRHRAWMRLRSEFGMRSIVAREVTHGFENGWHPHKHFALVMDRMIGSGRAESIEGEIWPAWLASLRAEGLDALRLPGAYLEMCTDAGGLAQYLLKVEGLAMELVLSDVRYGKLGHRSPERIALDMLETGDMSDRPLLVEHARATKGRRMLTWSRGLREEFLVEPELSDEEAAAADVGGVAVLHFDRGAWGRLLRVERGDGPLLLQERYELNGLVDACGWLVRSIGSEGWAVPS